MAPVAGVGLWLDRNMEGVVSEFSVTKDVCIQSVVTMVDDWFGIQQSSYVTTKGFSSIGIH